MKFAVDNLDAAIRITTTMHTDRWQRINEAFFAVIDTDPERRGMLLHDLCSGDPSLLEEVRSLVAAHCQAGEFIEAPVCIADEPRIEGTATRALEGLRFGAYRVVREIAHGGMGAVYLGERDDGEYQRQVAIKIVRRGLDTAPNLRRFRSERQILAKLEHPYIARLLDGGTSRDGLPYLVMEYVDGQPIDRYCDRLRLSILQRLHLFVKVCSAVQYAHQHFVIHRDLKPSNILITGEGDPKLLDFGIAKLLDWDLPSKNCSNTGTWAGPMTPGYASPEQVLGQPVSLATDIYSLGTLLYELLCGHRPYRTEGCPLHELLQTICEVMPEKPSARVQCLNHAVDLKGEAPALTPEEIGELRGERPERLRRRLTGDLDNIVLMAMRKEPQRRYSSVGQLAEDIRHHLEGLPVVARRSTLAYRGSRFLQRSWSWAIAVGLIAICLLAGIVIAAWKARIATASKMTQRQRFEEAMRPDSAGREARKEASPTRQDTKEAKRQQEDPEVLHKGLLKQLSRILEGHDTARGLVLDTSELTFDPGHVTLRPEARERLARIAGVLAMYPRLRLGVEGHTDNGGDDDLNLQVSEDRSNAVREYLSTHGISKKMITARGLGGSLPIALNDDEAGRQRNRRVEIVISGDMIGSRTPMLVPEGSPTPHSNAKAIASLLASEASTSPNLALHKTAAGSMACNSSEGPEKAFNGSVAGGDSDKWCSHASPAFLQVDLGATYSIGQLIVKHAGAGGEASVLNTRNFNLQVSSEGTIFTTVAEVTDNTQDITSHIVSPAVTARFVRLNITRPAQQDDNSSRIYELEIYSLARPQTDQETTPTSRRGVLSGLHSRQSLVHSKPHTLAREPARAGR